MSNAELILRAVDARLDCVVDLTLYGRAALHLGFPHPPLEYALQAARVPSVPEIEEQFRLCSQHFRLP